MSVYIYILMITITVYISCKMIDQLRAKNDWSRD